MSLVTYSPFRGFDPFFESEAATAPWEGFFSPDGARQKPRVDIVENESNFVLSAEVPGFSEDQIHVEVHDGMLTIKGTVAEKKAEEKDTVYLAREIRWNNFERSFRLGEQVDTEHVGARLDKGVLHITLPKKEAAKHRRIDVKVES